MKKKITAIVLAVVLCLSLAACKPADKPQDKVALGVIAQAAETLLSDKVGYKLTANYTTQTNATRQEQKMLSFEKRGGQIKVSDNLLIDLNRGEYFEKWDGKEKYHLGFLPQGVLEYVAGLLWDLPDEAIDGFDEENKTLTVSLVDTDKVNALLQPLIDAYKNDWSLEMLIDAYIAQKYGSFATFESLYDTFVNMLVENKDKTCGELWEQYGHGLKYEIAAGIFGYLGGWWDYPYIIKLKNVKFGDCLAATIEELRDSDAWFQNEKWDAWSFLDGLFYCTWEDVEPTDTSELRNLLQDFKPLALKILRQVKVIGDDDPDALINTLLEELDGGYFDEIGYVMNVLDQMIRQGAVFENLSTQIKFDNEMRLTSLTSVTDIQYTAEESQDNNFHATFDITVTDYTTSFTPWDIPPTYGYDDFDHDDDIVIDDDRYIFSMCSWIVSDGTKDRTYYFECCGQSWQIDHWEVKALCDDRPTEIISWDIVSENVTQIVFDRDSTTIFVPQSIFEEVRAKENYQGLFVCLAYDSDGNEIGGALLCDVGYATIQDILYYLFSPIDIT